MRKYFYQGESINLLFSTGDVALDLYTITATLQGYPVEVVKTSQTSFNIFVSYVNTRSMAEGRADLLIYFKKGTDVFIGKNTNLYICSPAYNKPVDVVQDGELTVTVVIDNNTVSFDIAINGGKDAFQLWLITHPNGTYEEFEAYYKGAKGDTGESGVYVGPTEPVDPKIKLWITPDGSDYDFMKEAAQTAITAAQLADDKAILAAQQAESAYSAAQLANDATSAAMNFIEEHEEDFVGFNLRISTAEEKINLLLEEPEEIQQFPSYLNFPNLGKINVLYIDTQENESYRWDNDNLKYYKINEIETINGGN